VAENAVFLIFYVEQFRAAGHDLVTALVHAGQVRARPITMTTLTAVLALLPLALGAGAGAQMQKPLAIAVIGGFSLSVPLLLFCLPPLYAPGHRSARLGTAGLHATRAEASPSPWWTVPCQSQRLSLTSTTCVVA